MGLTPEQQKRCDEIVERALAMEASARDAFVMEACGGDKELHHEAVALLSIELGTSVFDMSPATCMMPERFGRYQPEELIGSGGMSIVYRAMDPVIHRRVAIKVMAQRLEASAEEYQRFLTELHLLGSLGHPNIVQVFDAGDYQGMPFIVMEYLEGENLAEAIANDHCTSFSSKISIARQTAEALKRVHEANVCHRDVKPANVFLERAGRAKLMDFGVSARLNGPRMTQTGALIGTLPYLSPEQVRGEQPDFAVDIHAFGVLLYELFTGSKPFSGEPAQVLYKIAHDSVPLAPLAGLPPALVALIRKCTAKASAGRPHDFGEVLLALDRVSSEPGDTVFASHRRWRVGAAAAAAVFAATGLVWISGRQHSDRTQPLVTAAGTPSGTGGSVVTIAAPDVHQAPPPEMSAAPPASKTAPAETKPEVARKPEENPPKPLSTLREDPGSEARLHARLQSPPPAVRQRPEIQIADAPVPSPSSVDVKLPDAVAGLKDSLGTTNPPIAAPPSPSPSVQQHAFDSQKIRDVVGQYMAAYRNKNVREIRNVYPSNRDLKRLEETFADTKTMDYRLEPESEPEIEGDQARIHCKYSLIQTSIERSVLHRQGEPKKANPVSVVVRLARINGAWKITSIQ